MPITEPSVQIHALGIAFQQRFVSWPVERLIVTDMARQSLLQACMCSFVWEKYSSSSYLVRQVLPRHCLWKCQCYAIGSFSTLLLPFLLLACAIGGHICRVATEAELSRTLRYDPSTSGGHNGYKRKEHGKVLQISAKVCTCFYESRMHILVFAVVQYFQRPRSQWRYI